MPMLKNILTFLFVCAFSAPLYAQELSAVPQNAVQMQMSFAPIVKRVTPAVVNIYTRRIVTGRAMANPFFGDPFFAPFFENMGQARNKVEQSLGSGFIVDSKGLIVTNAHVIKGAQEIMVILNDGREFEAKTVLIDTPSDIGILSIDTKGIALPTLTLAPTDKLEVGDLVLAIGNPFGVGQTVTSGIISALARSNAAVNDYNFFIQTDAAINPGNSGGPLVAMDGTVIGVNSAIFSKSGGSMGIGFAVPAEMVSAVIAANQSGQISKRGVVRAWLGFAAQSVSADIATSLGFDRPQGALVSEVTKNGPADAAGLQRGDVILALDEREIRDADELKFRIATLPLGQKAQLKIRRSTGDEILNFTATAPAEIPAREPLNVTAPGPLSGATLINVSPAVIDEMDITNQEDGVVVQDVKGGSTAARLGLQTGDGLIAIGKHSVPDTSRLKALLTQQNQWVLTIRRNGRDQTLIFR